MTDSSLNLLDHKSCNASNVTCSKNRLLWLELLHTYGQLLDIIPACFRSCGKHHEAGSSTCPGICRAVTRALILSCCCCGRDAI
jgi:hypothetical protein